MSTDLIAEVSQHQPSMTSSNTAMFKWLEALKIWGFGTLILFMYLVNRVLF